MRGGADMLDIRIDEKRYPAGLTGHGRLALAGTAFCAAAGEFVCLVGPSGCGKSTLLNIVGGLDHDYRGTVHLDVADPAAQVSYMFQTPRLMPWLTVLDNVRLVLDGSAAAEKRARELLTAVELGDVLHAYPKQLSGGMQRRVALARAFVIQPQLLLLDEPFVSLDLPVANRLRALLGEQWQTSRPTVLFVTHELREALALADRVLFLAPTPGRVVLELPVTLPRPRHVDDPAVLVLQQQLLDEHPELLSGVVTAEPLNHSLINED